MPVPAESTAAVPAGRSELHTDAVRLVSAWSPPTPAAASTRQRFLDLLAEPTDATRADHPHAHLTASALVVGASLDLVLLCLHGRFGTWVQFGGHCEDLDTSVAAAALREAREESGIPELRLYPDPIDLDIHEVTCRFGRSLHFDVRFAALAPAGAAEKVSPESKALGWFPPDALPQPLAHATDRLIAPGLTVARRLQTR
ncbi:MAG TPA: NUDIX domain-containing protein [Micromonosporaceae bacterium]